MGKIEKKIVKSYFSKSSSGSFTPRVNFPKSWFEKLEISKEEREVEIELDEEKKEIRIKKVK